VIATAPQSNGAQNDEKIEQAIPTAESHANILM
jgi:hypothetical protein